MTWTTERILSGVDAGIREIINVYNSSYLYYVRAGVSLAASHSLAMDATIAHFQRLEQDIADSTPAFVDRVMAAIADLEAVETYEVSDQGDGTPMRYWSHRIHD